MNRLTITARSVGLATLIALTATPALAGREDRAKVAIAAAQAKIDAANKLGASTETPRLAAEAEAALRAAREDLARDRNAQAIDHANHAAMLADTALGQATKAKENREAALRADSERAEAARRLDAERAADAANARANAAEVAAAAAAADAAAARAAPPIVIQQPAPTTTVTTETVKTAPVAAPAPKAKTATKVTVKKPAPRKTTPRVATIAPRTTTERTTTTVTTDNN